LISQIHFFRIDTVLNSRKSSVYKHLLSVIETKGAAYLMLLDPDKAGDHDFEAFLTVCKESGVDGFLIGGSLLFTRETEELINRIKGLSDIPVILFPGDTNQVVSNADAILFISLISGRNPEHLIGKHVIAAPLIKRYGIEPISTGYMLIESGTTTAAEYMSGSKPIPANKPEIAVATALAAQFIGFQCVYLEAGSGAKNPVPLDMIRAVAHNTDIVLIVGGGLKTPDAAAEVIRAGAKIVVTGNHFENPEKRGDIPAFAKAVHYKESSLV